MPSAGTSSRRFQPDTAGWTVADLDDPEIEAQWARGNYEIVEGVLRRMPPAYFTGGRSLFQLMIIVERHLEREEIAADFAVEVEIVIDPTLLPRADAALLTVEDEARQVRAVKEAGRTSPERTRILVPPTLIIESVSPGHEAHDEQIKKKWYEEFGVPNYWLLNALNRSLRCHRLEAGAYRLDATGRDQDQLRPSAFPRLVIPLGRLWKQWKQA